MPLEEQSQLSSAALGRRLASEEAAPDTKLALASVLGEMGREHALEPAAWSALLEFARSVRSDARALSILEHVFENLQELDRPRVLRALREREYPLRPWLARLAKFAAPQDLPLLDTFFAMHMTEPQLRLALARLVWSMPGPEAQTTLEHWVVDGDDIPTQPALLLITRDKLDKTRLYDVLKRTHGAAKLIVALALDDAASRTRTEQLLESGSIEQRYIGSVVARLFGRSEMRKALWQNAVYRDARDYPGDLRLRHRALCALLGLELNGRPSPLNDGASN